jgi:effector-binding domain-containing protein
MAARQPQIEQRTEQPYVAITALVTMQTLGEVMPKLHPEVYGWLRSRGLTPAGDPFCKYNAIDMERELEIEVGVPVAADVTGDDRVLAGVLPAGRYATLRHYGHPNGLVDATVRLLDWVAQQDLPFDVEESSEGRRWVARLEIYQEAPPPDMDSWQTDLAFRLAD